MGWVSELGSFDNISDVGPAVTWGAGGAADDWPDIVSESAERTLAGRDEPVVAQGMGDDSLGTRNVSEEMDVYSLRKAPVVTAIAFSGATKDFHRESTSISSDALAFPRATDAFPRGAVPISSATCQIISGADPSGRPAEAISSPARLISRPALVLPEHEKTVASLGSLASAGTRGPGRQRNRTTIGLRGGVVPWRRASTRIEDAS